MCGSGPATGTQPNILQTTRRPAASQIILGAEVKKQATTLTNPKSKSLVRSSKAARICVHRIIVVATAQQRDTRSRSIHPQAMSVFVVSSEQDVRNGKRSRRQLKG